MVGRVAVAHVGLFVLTNATRECFARKVWEGVAWSSSPNAWEGVAWSSSPNAANVL